MLADIKNMKTKETHMMLSPRKNLYIPTLNCLYRSHRKKCDILGI